MSISFRRIIAILLAISVLSFSTGAGSKIYGQPSGQPQASEHLSLPSSAHFVFLRSVSEYNGNSSWAMQKAGELKNSGAEISLPDYKGQNWLQATVPGTVLHSLVLDGQYPDPYYGDNNRLSRNLIPDMAKAGREFYHYWFRTTFSVPRDYAGKRIWLKFHGINYRSVIWVNGKKIGAMAGMFKEQAFDITELVHRSGKNGLAVDISPVDFTGSNMAPKTAVPGAIGEGENGGDGEIGKNTTMLMTVGWDFTFPDGVRDRNTGIWKDVELFATGDVTLDHSYVQSSLPLPDTTSARETISVELTNHTKQAQAGTLTAEIKDLGITIAKPLQLQPSETRLVVLDTRDYPQLHINNPKLWWPVNKGAQPLYDLKLRFNTKKGISHEQSSQFGIRDIATDQNTPDSSRRFIVNGVPVFIRGANWIPEAMVRNTEKRTYTELRYIHQAGFNLLREWGGGITESDYFYHLCDSLGIMVWSEFWITGNTRFPADTSIYMDNLRNTIYRIRSHPSVAYYVSANESTELPGAGLVIKGLDSVTNYQRESECCGVHDGSPYTYVNPMQYYENTASKRGSRVDGFDPEYGSLCLPILSSLKEMMPQQDLWPINKKLWDYMDGGGFHKMTTDYKDAVNEFGRSASIAEFARKAQLVGAMNYRSLLDVWNYNKFTYGDRFASGFLFWYINSPEPQVASRLYDWSLEPTAALYYAQNALAPLHVQFDYLKNTISVYNDYRQAFKEYKVMADIYDIDSKRILHKEVSVDIPADGVRSDVMHLEFPDNTTQVHFIKLRLSSPAGKEVASSFYWRSKDAYKGAWTLTGPAVSGFQSLDSLKKTQLKAKAKMDLSGAHKDAVVHVQLTNVGSALAFFTQLQVVHADGSPLKGAFYSDNFLSLLPGENKQLSIEIPATPVKTGKLVLQITGMNCAPIELSID